MAGRGVVKLAIADPPYLGVAALWYGEDGGDRRVASPRSTLNGISRGAYPRPADSHPDAHLWDDPEQHRQLVERLDADYDGWAVAMKVSSLWHYLQWVDESRCRLAAWVKTSSMPTGARPIHSWEPVLLKVPDGRRRVEGNHLPVRDWVKTEGPVTGRPFAGRKPEAWTRWVLDMLGYNPETDTVDDLFAGSGAVSSAIAQGVLL